MSLCPPFSRTLSSRRIFPRQDRLHRTFIFFILLPVTTTLTMTTTVVALFATNKRTLSFAMQTVTRCPPLSRRALTTCELCANGKITSFISFSSFPTTSSSVSSIHHWSSPSRQFLCCLSSSASSTQTTSGPDELENPTSDNDANLTSYTLKLSVPTPDDMEDVGAILSVGTGGGDTILLGGDLGAGKTCLSRGFIRARTGVEDMRVTSPTYLLSNTYEADGGNTIIHHMDLYRLSGKKEDFEPLNMDHVLSKCISLIEWPSRLGVLTPQARLDVMLKIDIHDKGDDDEETKSRNLTLLAHGEKWADRLRFLEEEGYLDDLIIDSD